MTFTPYKVGTDPEFDKCLPPILVQEGGYSDDAHDPGGATDYGIIQTEYNIARKAWGLPTQPVSKITDDEYRTIYYTKYWLPYCPTLYPGLDLEFFNMAVNGGPGRAIELLQEAIGVTADMKFGPVTQAKVKSLWGSQPVIDTFKHDADEFYEHLGTFRYFGKDWLRRDTEIQSQADAMDKALDQFVADKPPPIMKES
jgi:lysozyme family protein